VQELKVYFNHFYFSLMVVLVGMIVIHMLLAVLGGASSLMGAQESGSGTVLTNNLGMTAILWVLISAVIAGVLTAQTIKNRPKDHTVFTRRAS
jgi:hypothetical protein